MAADMLIEELERLLFEETVNLYLHSGATAVMAVRYAQGME